MRQVKAFLRRMGVFVPGALLAGAVGWMAVGGVGGCTKTSQVREKEGVFVEGRARVVSVNPAIGMCTLEIDGRQVQGYWELERMTAQGGAVVQQGPLKPPLGDYREPIVHQQTFPARPGDVILFVAMKTGPDLFLRGVQVVK